MDALDSDVVARIETALRRRLTDGTADPDLRIVYFDRDTRHQISLQLELVAGTLVCTYERPPRAGKPMPLEITRHRLREDQIVGLAELLLRTRPWNDDDQGPGPPGSARPTILVELAAETISFNAWEGGVGRPAAQLRAALLKLSHSTWWSRWLRW